ncbi:hypothetical protein [Bergeyella zoohelcum]|nr:hypothetical protein [Bergeyella zoohelcum]MDY6025789.1 hypothetical protein [Bergeyella zoohelcum]
MLKSFVMSKMEAYHNGKNLRIGHCTWTIASLFAIVTSAYFL